MQKIINKKICDTETSTRSCSHASDIAEVCQVGEKNPQAIGRMDGLLFDITDAGAQLILCLKDPTPNELRQTKSDTPIEFKVAVINGIMILLVRFGDLPWFYAPYHPAMSIHLSELPVIQDGCGLLVLFRFYDTADGELKQIRAISLSTYFSKKLVKIASELASSDMSYDEYRRRTDHIYRFCPDSELLKHSIAHFKKY